MNHSKALIISLIMPDHGYEVGKLEFIPYYLYKIILCELSHVLDMIA